MICGVRLEFGFTAFSVNQTEARELAFDLYIVSLSSVAQYGCSTEAMSPTRNQHSHVCEDLAIILRQANGGMY